MLEYLWLQAGKAMASMAGARDREDGQALVEYALILFLVSVVCIAALNTLGDSINSVLGKISDDI